MTDHYDALETRSADEREAAQVAALGEILGRLDAAPGLARHLGGADAGAVRTLADLARLPVLRKAALIEMQAADPPFGGLTARPASAFDHVFQSPGPIFEPGMASPDWWRFARALHAAGLRDTDTMINCFAYHLTPAGHMLESGARAVGATVLAGGVGNTEGQARAAAMAGVGFYAGTPDFLRTLLDKADDLGLAVPVRAALVSGGPLFPLMREGYGARGIACLQCYATADVGLISYETTGPEGLCPGMVLDEGVIVEIVRPGTGDPVPDGEVGEVVVTALNPDYPLVRFATGDMSAILSGQSPCGRTGRRIKGWMGRADQTTKVKGMFVRPEQIAEVVRRHPEIARARLLVTRADDADAMTLRIETGTPEVAGAVEATLREVVALRGAVEAVAPGSLPNDGKVIEDARDLSA